MSEESLDPKWHTMYFQPGQILFHVNGNATVQSSQSWLGKANVRAKSMGLSISLEPRVQNFPFAEQYNKEESQSKRPSRQGEPFALFYADVTQNDTKLSGEEADLLQLLDLIFLLDKERNELDESLEVVSPNWLASGSSQPGGTGGPGGKPSPFHGFPDNNEFKFRYAESSNQEFLDHIRRGSGKGVVVAILDTAPGREELKEIYNEWVNKGNKNHSLLRTLINPEDMRLTVHNDARVSTPPMSEYQCIDYDYDMNDHGLFVAGIIHSLALEAELHLFQVLNRYGVGDLEVIGDSLLKVLSEFNPSNLIVNLSLNINIPLERGHTKEDRNDVSNVIGEKILNNLGHGKGSWLERVVQPPRLIFNLLYDNASAIIAAAGNDYSKEQENQGRNRPQARYPAAFENVVGVGALAIEKNALKPQGRAFVPASYSNIADRPPYKGITTFGGEEGEKNGILGIYVGKYPDGDEPASPPPPPNESGWAWWCGTSFATPVITGLAATVLSSMLLANGQATAQEAIQAVFDAQQDLIEGTNEDVFLVTQGSTL